jgi:hypothetical protein
MAVAVADRPPRTKTLTAAFFGFRMAVKGAVKAISRPS